MSIPILGIGHSWSQRDFRFDGKDYNHQHCLTCGRDFVRIGLGDWLAAYIGTFGVVPLDDAVNLRWLAEQCPGQRVWRDMLDRRGKA